MGFSFNNFIEFTVGRDLRCWIQSPYFIDEDTESQNVFMPLPKPQTAGIWVGWVKAERGRKGLDCPAKESVKHVTFTFHGELSPSFQHRKQPLKHHLWRPMWKITLGEQKTTSVWLWTHKNYRNHLFFAHQLWWLNSYKNQTWKKGKAVMLFYKMMAEYRAAPPSSLTDLIFFNSEQRSNLLV